MQHTRIVLTIALLLLASPALADTQFTSNRQNELIGYNIIDLEDGDVGISAPGSPASDKRGFVCIKFSPFAGMPNTTNLDDCGISGTGTLKIVGSSTNAYAGMIIKKVGDYKKQGKKNIAIHAAGEGNTYIVPFTRNQTGIKDLATSASIKFIGLSVSSLRFGDVDGNKKQDMVITGGTGKVYGFVNLANLSGTVTINQANFTINLNSTGIKAFIELANLTGDDKLDIIGTDPATRDLWVLPGRNTFPPIIELSNTIKFPAGFAEVIGNVGDLRGPDGYDDIAVRGRILGSQNVKNVYLFGKANITSRNLNSPNGTDVTEIIGLGNPMIEETDCTISDGGDYNKDGKYDAFFGDMINGRAKIALGQTSFQPTYTLSSNDPEFIGVMVGACVDYAKNTLPSNLGKNSRYLYSAHLSPNQAKALTVDTYKP